MVEEAQVLSALTSSRYSGLSPKQLVPQLADEGLYLASESTIYRLQRRHGLRPRNPTTSRTHVSRACAVHQATRPNQVWSWDITWLPTTVRGSTMISTLQWLGVVPSFSRPHVADNNPYSEALFRTMKRTPVYPRLPFADLASAQRWVARFVGITASIVTARSGT